MFFSSMIKLQAINGDQQQNRLYILFPLIPPWGRGCLGWGQPKYIKLKYAMYFPLNIAYTNKPPVAKL